MPNNFVTDQVNKTNLQGVRWRKFNTTWQKKEEKKVNTRGTEGNHTAGQIFGIVNARYFHNGLTQIRQIDRKFLAHYYTK